MEEAGRLALFGAVRIRADHTVKQLERAGELSLRGWPGLGIPASLEDASDQQRQPRPGEQEPEHGRILPKPPACW